MYFLGACKLVWFLNRVNNIHAFEARPSLALSLTNNHALQEGFP